jgi:DNA invertase Pin-like site-specific DNA recombinase
MIGCERLRSAVAVGYVRVSTGEQAAGGLGLEAQRGAIEAWAARSEARLVGIHADAGLSGGRADNRPGLGAAVEEACGRRAALVVQSLSRLARSTRDAIAISARLERAGADLVSLSERIDTTTAAGRMLFRVLAVLSEFERDLIAERTSTALRIKRLRGEYTGGDCPYGWRLGRDGITLEPVRREQVLIATARELRASGLSLRAVGRRLMERSMPPRHGGSWHAKTVRGLLTARGADELTGLGKECDDGHQASGDEVA